MQSAHAQVVVFRVQARAGPMLAVGAFATLLAAATGCSQSSKGSPAGPTAAAEPPSGPVTVVKPERATLRRAVRQPGYIQSFEQTPVFSKIPGYVQKWHVDIGDRVKKGDILAELRVPEMNVELKQKVALVQQAGAEIKQAKEAAAAAEKSYLSAVAKVEEAEVSRLRAQAEFQLYVSQYKRFEAAGSGVIDPNAVDEARLRRDSAKAATQEVEAKIKSAQADRDKSKAQWDKALADVSVAEAHLAVAGENRDYVETLLQYTKLRAPFEGVVTRRNINTDDFVQPAAGNKGEPLYVVERRDLMRVFVDVFEGDAEWVNKGAKARVRVQVLPGQEFTGEVARTSYSLDRTTRTLVAEIDLPNPQDRLRPGMYAYATITAEHPDVLTLPASAVVTQGDVTQGYQSYCFVVEDGKARRTLLQIGARGTERVEVLKKQANEKSAWEDFTGEEIVAANASGVADGQAVTAAQKP